MIPKFHPAVFLGAVILVCAAWLWVRPPVSAIETVARGRPRPALVVPKSIELDQALLEEACAVMRRARTISPRTSNGW